MRLAILAPLGRDRPPTAHERQAAISHNRGALGHTFDQRAYVAAIEVTNGTILPTRQYVNVEDALVLAGTPLEFFRVLRQVFFRQLGHCVARRGFRPLPLT